MQFRPISNHWQIITSWAFVFQRHDLNPKMLLMTTRKNCSINHSSSSEPIQLHCSVFTLYWCSKSHCAYKIRLLTTMQQYWGDEENKLNVFNITLQDEKHTCILYVYPRCWWRWRCRFRDHSNSFSFANIQHVTLRACISILCKSRFPRTTGTEPHHNHRAHKVTL